MKIVKTLAGMIAVLFSIQPLASWAAKPITAQASKVELEENKVTLTKLSVNRDDVAEKSGSPICRTC